MENYNILVTGGSGLLGRELQKILPAYYPTHEELDIDDEGIAGQIWRVYKERSNYIDTIVHLAAFTSPPKVNEHPMKAIRTNIIGTANLLWYALQKNAYFIYMSTDYVFSGFPGYFSEEDEVLPVNKYAWSKLGGECAVRMYDNSLIIRTSFGPEPFPYDKAFIDQYTSRQYVSVIAEKVKKIVTRNPQIIGTIHIGGDRKAVYEYAKITKPDVGQLSIKDVNFDVPVDTSLNCDKYNEIFEGVFE